MALTVMRTMDDLRRIADDAAQTTLQSIKPQTPKFLKATGLKHGFRIQWAQVDGVDGYRVTMMSNNNFANAEAQQELQGEQSVTLTWMYGDVAATRQFTVQSFKRMPTGEVLYSEPYYPFASVSSTASSGILSATTTRQTLTGTGGTPVAETAMVTYVLPAGTLGANDGLRVIVWGRTSGAAGNKSTGIRWNGVGGTLCAAATVAAGANPVTRLEAYIFNRNATNSQFCCGMGIDTAAIDTLNGNTAAADTTAAVDIVVTGQLADGADSVLIDLVAIERMSSSGDSAPTSASATLIAPSGSEDTGDPGGVPLPSKFL